VLITTLVTPQLLKVRYHRLRAAARPVGTPPDTPPPEGGWLRVGLDDVGLAARPPDDLAVPLALAAAIFLTRRRPEPALLDWLGDALPPTTSWDRGLTSTFLDVIERGNERSWRFLETTGVLDAALPELGAAFRRRAGDNFSLDGSGAHGLQAMRRLRLLDEEDPLSAEVRALENVDRLLLAAFLAEALEDEADIERTAGLILLRLEVSRADVDFVRALIHDRQLLWSAAHQPGALTEERVLQLAAHLDTPERARAQYVLAALQSDGRERWETQRLRALYDLVQTVLADDSLAGGDARSLVARRVAEATELVVGAPGAVDRLATAPRAYVLRTSSAAMARHALLLDPPPVRQTRVAVTAADDVGWWVDVAWQDDAGRLAAITKVLADRQLLVDDAVLATWPDGSVLDSFRLPLGTRPDADALAAAIQEAAGQPMTAPPLPDAEIEVDSAASPWHTVVEVRCTDRPGLLHSLATAFAAAGIEVRSARVSANDGLVIDRFEVTDRDGAKLSDRELERFQALIRSGVTTKRRRFSRRLAVKASAQP
jgi:UTP:GlnB (protein PII) uridylyltransferase